MSKADLFKAYQERRDPAVLRALLESYQEMIFNLAYQVLRHPQNAEDASQQVFLKLLDHLGKITDGEHLRRWICQVSFFTALDLKRGDARRMAHEKRRARSAEPPRTDGAETALEVVHEHMARLDYEARCLLADHYYGGQPLEALANRMECSTVAIWKKLEKARGALRKSMTLAGFGAFATGLESTLGAIVSVPAPPGLLSPAILAKVGTVAALTPPAATVVTGGIAVKLNMMAGGSVLALLGSLLVVGAIRHRNAPEVEAPPRLAHLVAAGPSTPAPAVTERRIASPESSGANLGAPSLAPDGQSSRVKNSLARMLAALRTREADKIRATLELLRGELSRTVIPDAQNAAVLYRKAFDKFTTKDEDWNQWIKQLDGDQWRKLMEQGMLLPQDQAALRTLLDKNQEALYLLHQAAELSECNFGVDYSKCLDAQDVSHLRKLTDASALLAIESLIADDSILPGVVKASDRLAEALADERLLLSQLERYNCQVAAADVRERSLQTPMRESDLQDMLSSLDPAKIREGLNGSILYEFYHTLDALLDGDKFKAFGLAAQGLLPATDPQADAGIAHFTETYSEVSDLLGKPYFEIRDRLDELTKTRVRSAPWYADLTRQMIPPFGRCAEMAAQAEASLGTAKVATAIKLYQAQNGQYPASLSDLGSILPDPLLDPFSGQPYLYRREGSGFVVYSVGKSGVENGGIAHPLEQALVLRVR